MSSSVPAVNFYIQFTPDQVTPPQVAPIVLTGNSSSGSTSLTVASGLTVWTNSVIVGPGIAAGTVVSGYSGTTITLSQALTANVTTGNEFVIVGAQTAKTWTITGASGSGSVITFTYSGTPTISAGQTVTISGITPSQYNGTYTVLTSTSSQFTVSSSATGSYSSGGTVAAGWSAFADWIEEVNIRSGRQHYLDRIESTTLEVTLDNRTGAFSSLGSTVVPRLPILFTATYNNYTYALFNGIVESIDTHIQDQLNANLSIRATDNLKFLALKYVNNTAFYATYVPQSNFVTNTTGAISWYRMNANTSFGGTLIDSLPYNATTAPGSGYNGRVIGSAFLDQPGVLLYETTTCADLTGGTGNGTGSTPQGSLYIPASFGGTTADAIDFWLIGEGTTNQVITTNLTPLIGFTAYTSKLWVNDLGQVQWDLTTGGTTTKAFNPTPVNDGLSGITSRSRWTATTSSSTSTASQSWLSPAVAPTRVEQSLVSRSTSEARPRRSRPTSTSSWSATWAQRATLAPSSTDRSSLATSRASCFAEPRTPPTAWPKSSWPRASATSPSLTPLIRPLWR